MAREWRPDSWRTFPVEQQPPYDDKDAVNAACMQVRTLPPLITSAEVELVRSQLAEVAAGNRFLIQGGDCAERFVDCAREPIEKKLKILLQMSLVLTWGARMPTLRIGRMAGQFSKPRSSPTEVIDGKEVPVYRGDNVNGYGLDERTPDPKRLVSGYFHSAATLNYARTLLASAFGDLHHARHWDLGFVRDDKLRAEYERMSGSIMDTLDFMRVIGAGDDGESVRRADVFVSHEGLHLPYEEAMTRLVVEGDVVEEGEVGEEGVTKQWYNLGAHFLWIGDRTRQLDHAHVEYFRGIANPVGIKVGPSTVPSELVELIRKLWPEPEKSPGKIVLITRMGAGKASELLPPILSAVKDANLPVVWTCDPMHGNTRKTDSGLKTRDFDDILAEVREVFEAHKVAGTHLGGLHFELTGENVTECLGGPERLREADLPERYTTYCDPRLNYAQSMELAFLVAQYLRTTSQTTAHDPASLAKWLGKSSE